MTERTPERSNAKVSRRGFIAGVGVSVLGSATATASGAGDPTNPRVVRLKPATGAVSYLLSVDGKIEASEPLCEASERRTGKTALGKLDRADIDEYRITGEITRLWSTGDIHVSVDGEAWTIPTDSDARPPAANTSAPVSDT